MKLGALIQMKVDIIKKVKKSKKIDYEEDCNTYNRNNNILFF